MRHSEAVHVRARQGRAEKYHRAADCAVCGKRLALPEIVAGKAQAMEGARSHCSRCNAGRGIAVVAPVAAPTTNEVKKRTERLALVQSNQELVAKTVSDGVRYVFAEKNLYSSAFFSVRPSGAVTTITLNNEHPLMALLGVLHRDDLEQAEAPVLRDRLLQAREGLELLLTAWAKYEDAQPTGVRKRTVEEARADWGREAIRPCRTR